ncbi:helix-turn-helix domain-containing protein [Alteromonas stellipolaris]|uniref:helix-turn-helix domain-containing protein n=1 Tax=Alteromonas stellipolaris TaxID=233316 RepID=UPI002737044B|nr:helix-turn-helix domain-containing protein [Alteromonas stellipolaris]MDP2594923.1 helix-turn-helix domain-containing protein [Alteromonas stellipolaris]
MLLFSANVNNTGRVLGAWCLFQAFYFCSPLIVVHAEDTVFANLIGWGYFFPASFGAFLYLYFRSAIIKKSFYLKDGIHATPLLLCLFLNIDFLFSSPAEKINIANNALHNENIQLLTQIITFVQAFVYLALSVRLITQSARQAGDTLSNFNPQIFTWLWIVLNLYAGMLLTEAVSTIIGANYTLAIVSDLIAFTLIYSVSMAQWREPNLFTIDNLSETSAEALNSTTKAQYFDSNTRAKLLENIVQYMEDEQPYLESELTLDALARYTNLSSHHLSEILNQQANKNFYQFVNEYRIKTVCSQIASNPKERLIDLALSAGFSSKSTFNAVFKQFRGMTPSQFRKQLKLDSE